MCRVQNSSHYIPRSSAFLQESDVPAKQSPAGNEATTHKPNLETRENKQGFAGGHEARIDSLIDQIFSMLKSRIEQLVISRQTNKEIRQAQGELIQAAVRKEIDSLLSGMEKRFVTGLVTGITTIVGSAIAIKFAAPKVLQNCGKLLKPVWGATKSLISKVANKIGELMKYQIQLGKTLGGKVGTAIQVTAAATQKQMSKLAIATTAKPTVPKNVTQYMDDTTSTTEYSATDGMPARKVVVPGSMYREVKSVVKDVSKLQKDIAISNAISSGFGGITSLNQGAGEHAAAKDEAKQLEAKAEQERAQTGRAMTNEEMQADSERISSTHAAYRDMIGLTRIVS